MNKKKILEQIIRVDHAGEFAAVQIYKGQLNAISSKYKMRDALNDMLQTEEDHLLFFNEQIKKNNVRPTVLLPIWKIMSYSLGYITASLGKKSAMACTVAIEETISEHYEKQLDLLQKYKIGSDSLVNDIKKIRNEEIEHKDAAIEHEARQLPCYGIASQIIKIGCKIAISLSKKI